MTKKRQILNIISEIRNSHSYMENIFLYGSCMNFYMILKSIFPESRPWYNVDHVITEIDGTFYDITGVVSGKGFLPFSEYYDKKGTSSAFKQMYNGEFEINADN